MPKIAFIPFDESIPNIKKGKKVRMQ